MSTVRDLFELECPFCGSDDCLQVELTVMADLSADGTDVFGDQFWDGDSLMLCANCDHSGTVTDFEIDPNTQDAVPTDVPPINQNTGDNT